MKWYDVKVDLPKETNRYFVLIQMIDPYLYKNPDEKKVIPATSDYSIRTGWETDTSQFKVIFWCHIPKLPEGFEDIFPKKVWGEHFDAGDEYEIKTV